MFFKMKKAQKGRSMVEMVGVLFVVGLLSIIGVFTYRMVMKRVSYTKIEDFVDQFFTTIMREYYLPTKSSELHCFKTSEGSYSKNALNYICKSLDAEFCEGEQVSYSGYYFMDHGKNSDLYFGWEVTPGHPTNKTFLVASFWTSSSDMCEHVLNYIQARDSYWEVISNTRYATVGRGNLKGYDVAFPLSNADIQRACQPIETAYHGRTSIPVGFWLRIPLYPCD